MVEERIAIVDLADDLQVRKQRLFKVLKRLGIRPTLRRGSAKHGQNVATVTSAEAATIRQALARSDRDGRRPARAGRDNLHPYDVGDELGVFYLVQLEPQHDQGRFKLGFTTELDGRLRKHRTAAPFAHCEKSWPCRRAWERTAIDCVTAGCERLHTEVFRTTSLADVVRRADEFFAIMPKVGHETDEE
jgi:hypothetical protein